MSDLLKLVGLQIRNIRKTKALTKEEFAEKVRLHNSYIGGIDQGERNVSIERHWRSSVPL
jgi:transcriptional regulator with XRE-family HTH domain